MAENVGADRCKSGLLFTDASHGFITAWDHGLRPTIYLTRDGGKNWTGVDLPDPPDFKTTSVFPKFSFESVSVMRAGKSMYVVAWGTQPGDSDRNYVFRSNDGGASWSSIARVPRQDIVVVTESRWLKLSMPGDSLESSDAGQQWHLFASDFNSGGGRVNFGDSQVGYQGGYGVILRTLDGGTHWDRIQAPGMPSIDLLPVTDPGFTCRLAVGSGAFGNSSNGGFVAVPRGRFEFDPAATMVRVAGERWAETTVQPVLRGNSGVVAYDASFARWLPTSTHAVSSDGTQYAWVEGPWPGKVVHVTNVTDGSDRSFAAARPNDPDLKNAGPVSPGPIGVTKDSVFLTYSYEGAYGVWRLDLATGALIKVTGLPSPSYGAGAIWVTPTRGPNHVGMYSDGDTLARLDLASGAAVDWFHRDNFAVGYLGVDGAGNPWVEAISRPTSNWIVEIWRVRGPGQADLIVSGQRANRVVTDSHGTWFGNETGVYLYADGRLQRVSSASVGEVVGRCT
jgi:photosystem II stability/assembly factor-like uncharacterized protein